MSNIGKHKIQIPGGLVIQIKSFGPFYQLLISRGKGEGFGIVLPTDCKIVVEKNIMSVDYSTSPEMWGTVHTKIRQMISAVTSGHSLTLKLSGIGYKARSDAKTLTLSLGYTKDIEMEIPEGIKTICPTQTEINISTVIGESTIETLTAFAHKIVNIRPATPPLNKGVTVVRG